MEDTIKREIKRFVCKHCLKPFYYPERSFRLKAEKGESRPERCEECQQSHGEETREIKIPYFLSKQRVPVSIFTSLKSGFTFHGERVLQAEPPKKTDWSGMKVSITSEGIEKEFYPMLRENQVVVVEGQTGCGKSTVIPRYLIEPPEDYEEDFTEWLIRQGQIIITQPTTSATERISRTIAENSGYSLPDKGQIIGYRHGGEVGQEGEKLDDWNLLGFATDGSLRNWIREGKISQYSVIMIDEAHQRTINIDTLLMFLKNELPKNPSLRAIISSATINIEEFIGTFKKEGISVGFWGIPEVKKQKRFIHYWKQENSAKDETGAKDCNCWLCRDTEKKVLFWQDKGKRPKESELPRVAANFTLKILKEEPKGGSILVFFPGEWTIKETAKRILSKCPPSVNVIQIYRRLGTDEVLRLLGDKSKRRIILSTNIAETSHTLDDVDYVIDSGYIKEAEWDPETWISTLPTKPHSQAGRKQRWGRVGRVRDGYVYCLYTKEEFDQSEIHTPPEVVRSCLDELLLTSAAAGLPNIENLPWVRRPEELVSSQRHEEKEIGERWQKEIKRSQKAIKEGGLVGSNNLITEKALEIFHIPRSSNEIQLLQLADECNCLLETLTTLFLMITREGEPRTGANLYAEGLGLLLWEPEWTAKTKMRVWSLHQGLKIGCRDDLDFVIKLSFCFWRFKKQSEVLAQRWAEYYFINYRVIRETIENVEKLLSYPYRKKARKEEARENVELNFLERVRSVVATAWQHRIVSLKPGEPVTYLVQGKAKVGAVSHLCAGSWQGKHKAIVTTATEEEVIVDGYPRKVPIASFMVELPSQKPVVNFTNLFADQRFPIDSWVEVREENGKTYLVDLVLLPQPIKISYKKDLETVKEQPLEGKIIFFDKRFIEDMEISLPLKGIWAGSRKVGQARIIGWIERDGIPVAVLSPFLENRIAKTEKKIGDRVRVTIHKVARDPVGSGGWIIARTPSGFDIPVELSEMSLSPSGPGLEQIEGKTVDLTIEDINSEGDPQLSNLNKITEDLKSLREQVAAGTEINIKGYIEEIRKEEERGVVSVPRTFGVVHSFEIHQDFVPGKQITNLRVGEEVVVRFSLPSTQEDHVRGDYFFREEIDAVPSCLRYDDKKDEMLFSYCLDEKDLSKWTVRPEVIDFVRRHSWQYCLQARIVSLKERLSKLNEMDLVEGRIQQIDYEEDGKIKSVQVVISSDVPGFAFGSDLGSLSVSEGDKIQFYIKAVDPNSGFLKLVSKQSEKEFIKRTQDNIQRWQNNIRKARENIAKNSARLKTARSKEYENMVKSWIAEDERKIRDWLVKIESARSKLRQR